MKHTSSIKEILKKIHVMLMSPLKDKIMLFNVESTMSTDRE